MVTITKTKIDRKERGLLVELVGELKEIKDHLRKFLMLLPEESLRDYSNVSEIKRAYRQATKVYPPR